MRLDEDLSFLLGRGVYLIGTVLRMECFSDNMTAQAVCYKA